MPDHPMTYNRADVLPAKARLAALVLSFDCLAYAPGMGDDATDPYGPAASMRDAWAAAFASGVPEEVDALAERIKLLHFRQWLMDYASSGAQVAGAACLEAYNHRTVGKVCEALHIPVPTVGTVVSHLSPLNRYAWRAWVLGHDPRTILSHAVAGGTHLQRLATTPSGEVFPWLG